MDDQDFQTLVREAQAGDHAAADRIRPAQSMGEAPLQLGDRLLLEAATEFRFQTRGDARDPVGNLAYVSARMETGFGHDSWVVADAYGATLCERQAPDGTLLFDGPGQRFSGPELTLGRDRAVALALEIASGRRRTRRA